MYKDKKEPRGFFVEKESFFVHACVVILAVAIVARLLGTMTLWSDPFLLSTQIALPVCCALLLILFLLVFGRIALWTTILPVLGGAAFFILSASGEGFGLKTIVCIVMAFLAAFIYTATLAGMIRTKWLNVAVFTVILAYQIAFLAVPLFGDMLNPVGFAEGTTLISSICFVLAMLFACLAFRRRKTAPEPVELPKIKDPKVIVPKAEEKKETEEAEAAGPLAALPQEEPDELPTGTQTAAVEESPEEQ